MSNDLGETSTEGKLALSGAPQFTEKIEDQKTGIDAPWKIAAKVTGESRVVSLKFYSLIYQIDDMNFLQTDTRCFTFKCFLLQYVIS